MTFLAKSQNIGFSAYSTNFVLASKTPHLRPYNVRLENGSFDHAN